MQAIKSNATAVRSYCGLDFRHGPLILLQLQYARSIAVRMYAVQNAIEQDLFLLGYDFFIVNPLGFCSSTHSLHNNEF